MVGEDKGDVQSMGRQKMLATVQALKSDDNLGDALLVALGTLFLLLSFPFFPIYVVPILAIITGLIAYSHPPIGTIASMFLAFPAIAYQAPVLAWVYMAVLALTLFEAFSHWSTISFLQVAIMAPFAPFPFSLISGFLFAALGIASLRFGSKHSFAVSLPAIFMVLLLSSLWLTQNSSFITISNSHSSLYGPGIPQLQNKAQPEVGIAELFTASGNAIGALFSGENIRAFSEALGKIASNSVALLISDFASVQLAVWAAALFACAFLPARFEHKYKQTISASALFLVPIVNFLLAPFFNNPAEPLSFVYCALSVGVIGAMEHYGFKLSRERQVVRQERQKAFGKFGLQDLGGSEGVDSLNDVGGYKDVKLELREAIIAPIKQKELAYTYGIKPPNGILLFGPPGTGKTLLMKALAKELNVGFYYVKCSDLLSEWYGESLPYREKIMVMENGRMALAKIGEIVERKRKVKVLSFDSHGSAVFADIKDFIKHKCTSPIYEVKTRTGRKIRVTGYHSLFTLKEGRVEDVKTSDLEPKKSYIAVPGRMPLSSSPIGRIEFLRALEKEDFGMRVKGVKKPLREAMQKLGVSRACETLGMKSPAYLRNILRANIGVGAKEFLALMNEAQVDFDASDVLVCSGSKKLAGENEITPELAFFLGLWVAEGSYNSNHTVRISTSEQELPGIEAVCRKLFGKITVYAKKGKNGSQGRGRDICISSRALFVLMHDVLGLQDGADRKKVPDIAFSFSQENLSSFLRGYFTGDGSVYENQKGFATVEASTVSAELSDQLLYLLLAFGIVGTVYEKKEWSGSMSKRICLTGEQLKRFGEAVGFADERKNRRLAASVARGRWHRGSQIPISGLASSMRNALPENAFGYDTVGRDILQRHADGMQEDAFSGAIPADIYWDRVESITRVADEEYVYDISVDPCQNFVGGFGGIFAHNSEKNLSEVFAIARKRAPCVLFFDEIDSIGKRRDSYTSDDVAPRLMSVLLEEMDGFKGKKNVITIGATNIPDQLDPALMRPGRFDKIIYMHLPDAEARKEIFKVHLSKLPTDKNMDYDKLGQISERYSGADIKNICTEASRLAAREAVAANVIVNISMNHIATTIKKMKPSTSLDQLETYSKFRMDYERRTEAEEKKPEEKLVRWEDIGGLQDVREILHEAIEIPLLHEDVMKEMGVKPSKGLLLFGPPGCGKTMMVKAAANELKVNFMTISGAEIMRERSKSPAVYVKEVFNRARESAPALIFIDEMEALAPNRDEYRGGILTDLLQELDGVKELKNVMLIGATNKPSMLDPAILRPGRFDKIVYIPPPDMPARQHIFATNLAKFLKGLSLDALAKATEGFSGADVASICQEVKMQLVRDKLKGKPSVLTNESVMKVIADRRPSITRKDLMEYDSFRKEYGERK